VPKLDIFGNHATCCSSASGGPRREFWHDDLVSIWLHLARFAGCKVVHEKSGIVVAQPNFRADLYFPQLKYIIDLRTAVTCDKALCPKAAVTPGAAAEAGTAKKDDKWKAPVEAQGDTFIAPVHEEGGRISEPALNLLDSFARRFGNTNIEQATYKTYALQRLHTVGQIGVARLCRAVKPTPVGPRQISNPISALRFGVPSRRPVGLALVLNSSATRPLWHATAVHRISTAAVANALTPQPFVAPFLTPFIAFAPFDLFDNAACSSGSLIYCLAD
jgi:hypothetical protein